MHFLFPHIRVGLLIRTILTRQWDDEAWPLVPAGVRGRRWRFAAGYVRRAGGTKRAGRQYTGSRSRSSMTSMLCQLDIYASVRLVRDGAPGRKPMRSGTSFQWCGCRCRTCDVFE